MIGIYQGDNLEVMKTFSSDWFELIYVDPPFNTGKTQKRGDLFYEDKYYDLIEFLEPRMREAYRLLTCNGVLFFHIDYREVHYCKVMLDDIFGRDSFINEIIWSYDYGARNKNKWSTKHDNILFYAKNPKKYTFNYEEIKRIPYLAPERQTKERVETGKPETDVWWNTIVPTQSKENLGYPTQKPEAILERIIKVCSNKNDFVLDFFAGSGTTGAVCKKYDRHCFLIDNNPQAIEIMEKRLGVKHDSI